RWRIRSPPRWNSACPRRSAARSDRRRALPPAPKASRSRTSGSLNAFRFRLRGTDDQNAVRIDLEVLRGKDHGGRAEFLHDRRPFEPKTRRQHRALVDRRVAERAVEVDRADRLARRRRGAARRELGYFRPFDQPKAGNAEIDELDLLFPGVIVAERAQVRRVEGIDERCQKCGIDRAGGRRDADLHRLAGIADIGLARDPDARKIDPVAYEAVD